MFGLLNQEWSSCKFYRVDGLSKAPSHIPMRITCHLDYVSKVKVKVCSSFCGDRGLSQNAGKLLFGTCPWIFRLYSIHAVHKQYSLLDTTFNYIVSLKPPGTYFWLSHPNSLHVIVVGCSHRAGGWGCMFCVIWFCFEPLQVIMYGPLCISRSPSTTIRASGRQNGIT